jgi:hypothetical protein
MNKTFTIIMAIMLMMLSACSALGQEVTQGLTGKGVKIGINLAKLTGDDVPVDAKMKMGIVGGAFITYNLSPSIAIQPELLYTMKGTKWDIDETVSEDGIQVKLTGTDKYNLTYVQVPILVKFMIPTEGNIKPNLFAGPAIGFLLSAKNKTKVTGTAEGVSATIDTDVDIKDYVKSTDFSLVFGAGAGFVMGNGMITVDARYDLGLSSIMKEETDEETHTTSTPKVKTSTISIMVGYSF